MATYLTLIEAAKLQQTPLQKGVIEIFPRVAPVLQWLPFFPINGQAYIYNLEKTLPGVAFRGVNTSYTADQGIVNPTVERLFILGGISQYDRALVKTQGNLNNLRAIHDGMKAKAAALLYQDTFFNGSNTTNPTEFDGLNVRIIGNQIVDAEGAVFDLACLDKAIDQIEGTPDVIFTCKEGRREISAGVRAAGQAIETVNGVFGQQLPAYAGIPIQVIGDNHLGQGTIEPFNCKYDIYVVKFGVKENVCGLQSGALDVEDLGLSGCMYETLIEWIAGLGVFHPKAASIYKNVRLGTAICEDECTTTSTSTSTSSTSSTA